MRYSRVLVRLGLIVQRRQMSKRSSGAAVNDQAGAAETGRKRKKLAEVIDVSD
jgi:hypothetical protein